MGLHALPSGPQAGPESPPRMRSGTWSRCGVVRSWGWEKEEANNSLSPDQSSPLFRGPEGKNPLEAGCATGSGKEQSAARADGMGSILARRGAGRAAGLCLRCPGTAAWRRLNALPLGGSHLEGGTRSVDLHPGPETPRLLAGVMDGARTRPLLRSRDGGKGT